MEKLNYVIAELEDSHGVRRIARATSKNQLTVRIYQGSNKRTQDWWVDEVIFEDGDIIFKVNKVETEEPMN